jgi:hypothetical protein
MLTCANAIKGDSTGSRPRIDMRLLTCDILCQDHVSRMLSSIAGGKMMIRLRGLVDLVSWSSGYNAGDSGASVSCAAWFSE